MIDLLAKPRVAPYLALCRAAWIACWGNNPKRVEQTAKVIGEERAAKLLFDPTFDNARKLITQGKFLDAKTVVKEWVWDPLTLLLDETEIALGTDTAA